MAEQPPTSAPLTDTPAPAEPPAMTDIQAQAEALVQESRALNERLTVQLAEGGAAPPAAAKATEVTLVEAKSVFPKYSTKDNVVKEVVPEGCLWGITGEDWRKIIGCFVVLYLFLAAYYAGLITIAVHIRGGEQYKSLPSKYYGPFDRDFYFSMMGSRRQTLEPLYPWIKATECPENLGHYVCTPECDVETVDHHLTLTPKDHGCNTYNACCSEEHFPLPTYGNEYECKAMSGTDVTPAVTNDHKKCVNP